MELLAQGYCTVPSTVFSGPAITLGAMRHGRPGFLDHYRIAKRLSKSLAYVLHQPMQFSHISHCEVFSPVLLTIPTKLTVMYLLALNKKA